MIVAKYIVEISGQLRYKKSSEQVVEITGRWIKFIDGKAKYEIDYFAGLFTMIRWRGKDVDIYKIDNMMTSIRQSIMQLFVASKVTIEVHYIESGG